MLFPDGTEAGQIHIYNSDDPKAKLPTRGFVRKKYVARTEGQSPSDQSKKSTEAVVIRTKPSVIGGSVKQPTVIPLTKEQIDAVLRSLKVPVPVSKSQVIDAGTQSSPVDEQIESNVEVSTVQSDGIEESTIMKDLNEKTPVITINTPEKVSNKRPAPVADAIPLEKRVKLDFASPVSEDQSPVLAESTINRFRKKISDVKPSPQRALHLAPEFANPMESMAPSGDASTSEHAEKPKKIEIIINESGVQTPNNSSIKTKTVASPKKVTHTMLQVPNASPGSLVQSPISGSSKTNPTVVHISGQSATILHLPIVNLENTPQQNVQIIQGGQVLQIPSASCSVGTTVSSPRVFTINPQSSQGALTLANVQLVPQTSPKGPSNVTTIIRPVATKAVASPKAGSQIVAPQVLNQSQVYLSKSPGGFVPITNTSVNIPKVIVAASNLQVGEMSTSTVLTGGTS